MADELDLRVDLNTEDDAGLPWAFLREARDPALIREGAWIIVGSGNVRAVAQVAQVEGEAEMSSSLPMRFHGALDGGSAERGDRCLEEVTRN